MKKIIITLVIAIAIVYIALEFKSMSNKKIDTITTDVVATSTITTASSSPDIVKVVEKEQLLEVIPYVDSTSKFSLYLPKDWKVENRAQATTTLYTWFHNPSGLKDISNMKIVVERFTRTEKANLLIKSMGKDAFLEKLIDDVKLSSNNYNLVSSGKITINGLEYKEVVGTYIGNKTKKPATQYIYVTMTDDAYYLVASDVYTEMWGNVKEGVLGSLKTFKVL